MIDGGLIRAMHGLLQTSTMSHSPRETMKPIWALLALAVSVLAGCNNSTDVAGPIHPVTGRIDFPLEAGGLWTYDASTSTHNFRPAVPGATFRDTVIRWNAVVQSLGRDTLRDSIEVWKIHANESMQGSFSADCFYVVGRDTLFQFAYTGGSQIFPVQPSAYQFEYGGRSYASIGDLVDAFGLRVISGLFSAVNDTLFEPRPPKALIFPLRQGLEWNYRETGYPFRIGKKVLGEVFLLTRAGFFPVSKIQWMWDIRNRGVWDSTLAGYEYVSPRGLIRREFLMNDVGLTGPDDPEPIGYFDLKTEYVLTSTNVL
jgi:hypothetical protein